MAAPYIIGGGAIALLAISKKFQDDQIAKLSNPIALKLNVPALAPNQMTISDAGIRHIVSSESFKPNVHKDPTGNWTIGLGHLVKKGDPFYPYGPIKLITLSQAYDIFRKDASTAIDGVKKYIKAPLTQAQFDVLVSMVFNGGPGMIAGEIANYINTGKFLDAGNSLLKFVWSTVKGTNKKVKLPGLVIRRNTERAAFLGLIPWG